MSLNKGTKTNQFITKLMLRLSRFLAKAIVIFIFFLIKKKIFFLQLFLFSYISLLFYPNNQVILKYCGH